MIRRLGQFMLVGILCGMAFLGIGGRVAMRGLALAVGRPTNFGLGATAGIVLIGSLLGLVGGVAFALMSKRLPGTTAGKGMLFGTLFLGVLIPLQPAAVQEEIEAFRGHLFLATLCFWLIFACYGATMAVVVDRWDGQTK
jgi:hypothetical protein